MIYKSYLIEQNINLIDKNLFLFFGENIGLKNEFKNKIQLSNKDTTIIKYVQEEIIKNEESFFDEILNISLFDKKKFYFIEQSNDKILEIIRKIELKIQDSKIFLFADVLEKKSKLRNYFEKSKNIGAVPCYLDNEMSIKKIIMETLKGFKGLSSQNVNMIINNCNLDRLKLNNELNKIKTLFIDKNIESNKLESLMNPKLNDNFYLIKDEALKGNKIKTNEMLGNTIFDDEKNILYLSTINQRLYKLQETFELLKSTNLETAINTLKPPIFWKDKPSFIEQSKKWNSDKIKKILNKTYDLEIKIKSNPIINKNILIKKMLVDICELANA
jgi:DNA polymerase III subunit delta